MRCRAGPCNCTFPSFLFWQRSRKMIVVCECATNRWPVCRHPRRSHGTRARYVTNPQPSLCPPGQPWAQLRSPFPAAKALQPPAPTTHLDGGILMAFACISAVGPGSAPWPAGQLAWVPPAQHEAGVLRSLASACLPAWPCSALLCAAPLQRGPFRLPSSASCVSIRRCMTTLSSCVSASLT